MALQSSGAISLSQIQDEFGGVNPIGLNEYYRNGSYTTANNTSVPTSGTIDMADFYSTQKGVTVTYEFIGAGGGGGAGDTSTNNGQAGGNTTFTYRAAGDASNTTLTSNGGEGGLGAQQTGWGDGEDSYYGSGGTGGTSSDSSNQTAGFEPAATAYGAGGGGGGAHTFAERNGGIGGGAGGTEGTAYTVTAWNSSTTLTRNIGMPTTGSIVAEPGVDITVVIGEGGAGGTGFTQGAKGADGYAEIVVGSTTYTFTTPGTYTIPVPTAFLQVISTNQQELDLGTYLTGQGWNGTDNVDLVIDSGIYIWSDDNTTAGLTIPTSLNGKLTIYNNGYIIGRGGNGGHGVLDNGDDGGDAISNSATGVTLINNSGSYIAGGGGGGASGGWFNHGPGGGGGAGGGIGGGNQINSGTVYSSGGLGGTVGNSGSDGPSGGNNTSGLGGQAGGSGGGVNENSGTDSSGTGGGGGRVLPGIGVNARIPTGNLPDWPGGYGGGAGQTGGDSGRPYYANPTSTGGSGTRDMGAGGGGWGAAGGNSQNSSGTVLASGGAAGAAISGTAITVTNNGTIYGSQA